MSIFNKKTSMTLDEIIVAHMNNKYNDNFTISSVSYADFFQGIDIFKLTCTKFPNTTILVDHTKDGIISDNYLSILYNNKHRELLQKLMTNLIGECIVYTEISNTPANLSSELSFDEYKGEITSDLYGEVNIKSDANFNFNNFLNKYVSTLKEHNLLQGQLYINVFKDPSNYEKLDPNNYTKLPGLMLDYYSRRYYISIGKDFSIYCKDIEHY